MLHDIVQALTGYVSHLSDADLLIIAGVVATAVQFFVNRVRDLGRLENYLLSFPLPFVTATALFFPKGEATFSKGSLAYVAAQLVYLIVTEIARRAQAKVAPVTTAGYVSVDNGVVTATSTTGTNF